MQHLVSTNTKRNFESSEGNRRAVRRKEESGFPLCFKGIKKSYFVRNYTPEKKFFQQKRGTKKRREEKFFLPALVFVLDQQLALRA